MGETTAASSMTRPALIGELRGLLDIASDDELRVMHTIIHRFMGLGRTNYGPLNLATDRRDFAKEMSEEAIDALVYWAAESIRRVSAPPSESPNEFASAGVGRPITSQRPPTTAPSAASRPSLPVTSLTTTTKTRARVPTLEKKEEEE